MAVCSMVTQHSGQYISDYFNKEEVMQTWSTKMYGYGMIGRFIGHLT